MLFGVSLHLLVDRRMNSFDKKKAITKAIVEVGRDYKLSKSRVLIARVAEKLWCNRVE